MKKIVFLITAVLMSLSMILHAQPRDPQHKVTPEQRAAQMVERLHKELTLTEKQQEELKTWFTRSFTQQKEEFDKNRSNREAMRQFREKQRKANDAELKKVLTAEQYKKYEENQRKRQEARRNQMRQGHRGHRGMQR